MIRIIRGSRKEFFLELSDEDGRPFDLTGYTTFKVCIPNGNSAGVEISEVANANGSVVSVSGNALLGVLKVDLKSADSTSLDPEERTFIDVLIGNGTAADDLGERFDDAVSIIDSTCVA